VHSSAIKASPPYTVKEKKHRAIYRLCENRACQPTMPFIILPTPGAMKNCAIRVGLFGTWLKYLDQIYAGLIRSRLGISFPLKTMYASPTKVSASAPSQSSLPRIASSRYVASHSRQSKTLDNCAIFLQHSDQCKFSLHFANNVDFKHISPRNFAMKCRYKSPTDLGLAYHLGVCARSRTDELPSCRDSAEKSNSEVASKSIKAEG